MPQQPIKPHSFLQSIFYHLFPGVLTAGFYFLIRQPVINHGYPSIFALIIAAVVFLIPVELGFLLYQGQKTTGRLTLKGVISYTDSIPWWQMVLWVVLVFVATGLIFTLLKPVDAVLKEKVFFWVPGPENGLDGSVTRSVLIVTYALFFIFLAVLAPLVEELYFRGYLLPRTPGKFGGWLHSFLFAVYHFFTPWMIITRTLGLMPLVYAVKKKNLYVGIITHILVNSLDVITAVVFISNMV